MKWFFRDITDDPSEKELTQQDQFNNDEVGLAEALVRETIQNSTDARVIADQPVTVRFTIGEASRDGCAFFDDLMSGLKDHLVACDIEVPATWRSQNRSGSTSGQMVFRSCRKAGSCREACC